MAAQDVAFEMVDIPGKGKGLVAARDIKAGEQILVEKPAFVVKDLERTEATVAAAVAKLSPSDRLVFNSLALADPRHGPHLGRFMTNAFAMDTGTAGVLLVASRFNHSCAPNISRRFETPMMHTRFIAAVDIDQGTELEITYDPNELCQPRFRRQQTLYLGYGFRCTCRACSLTGANQLESDERRVKVDIIRNELQKHVAQPVKLAELAKEALALLEEEGLVTGRAAFAWAGFSAAAAHCDVESAKAWAGKHLELLEREAGIESSEYQEIRQYQRNPRLWEAWGAGDEAQAVPGP
ncbi:hypothetical protein JCM9279_002027 [Rhodotorula babjevae]